MFVACLSLGELVAADATAATETAAPPATPVEAAESAANSSRLVKDGVVVDFSIERVASAGEVEQPLMEGDYAEVRFRMTDAASGLAVRGLKPAAWMDIGSVIQGQKGEQKDCRGKIGLYLKGIVGIRPMVDLNSYYLLVLNKDPSISVIDPVVSMTGNTSLYASVLLKRPAADWAKSRDEKRLYVSMPRAGAVAVVDTEAFKVETNVEAGKEPTRVALQPDGRYLWVGNDAKEAPESGVTVIDTETLKQAARIPTGRGHHELAFSADGRFAFVTNRDEGTVSVIDVAQLRKVKDLRAGPVPISVASSALSQMLYVADGKKGRIAAIDAARLEVIARIDAKPGLGPLRFSQDGRWGFAVNTPEHAVHVIDAADNRLVHTIPVGGEPYQVAFTRAFAYVRLLDSERVSVINLSSLGDGKKPTVQSFPAGTGAPKVVADLSMADGIAQAASEAGVFVVSPADNNTFFYMEGMNAPMGNFGGYGHAARAVAVVDRSLKEVEPGVYAGRLRIPAAGKYDVAFLLDSPRVLHCFGAEAKENPSLKRRLGALEIDYLPLPATIAAGETLSLRFKLADPANHRPRTGLGDVKALYYVAPGQLRTEVAAREVGEAVYEAKLPLPRAGAYYVYVSSPSLNVKYGDLPFRALRVEGAAKVPPPAVKGRGSDAAKEDARVGDAHEPDGG